MSNHSSFTISAKKINRNFVKNRNPNPSPGEVLTIETERTPVVITVLIPSLDGYREGYLPNLLSQINAQNFRNFEVLLIKKDPRQGRALNVGASIAKGKYLLTLDDDTSLPDPDTFAKLINVMENNANIGIAGGNNTIPINAGRVVKRVMREVPRRSWGMVNEITESDLAEHPCMIMRTDEFKAIGGENELIPRGLDPYLRMAYRDNHMRVVVVPEVYYHHLPPKHLSGLLRQFYRNGYQAAFTNKNFPQWIIETPSTHRPVKPTKPLSIRACRAPFKIMNALFSGKPLLFVCEIAYCIGFLRSLAQHETPS